MLSKSFKISGGLCFKVNVGVTKLCPGLSASDELKKKKQVFCLEKNLYDPLGRKMSVICSLVSTLDHIVFRNCLK